MHWTQTPDRPIDPPEINTLPYENEDNAYEMYIAMHDGE